MTVENWWALACWAYARGMWMCHQAVLRERIASTRVPDCWLLHLCLMRLSITEVFAIMRCRSTTCPAPVIPTVSVTDRESQNFWV